LGWHTLQMPQLRVDQRHDTPALRLAQERVPVRAQGDELSDARHVGVGPRAGQDQAGFECQRRRHGRACCTRMRMNAELREKGYVRAPGLLDPMLARVLYKTLLLQHWRGESFRDNHMPTATSVSNTSLTDALLLELRPRIEAIAGVRLVPTYSY